MNYLEETIDPVDREGGHKTQVVCSLSNSSLLRKRRERMNVNNDNNDK